jgi:hypothetical protein
MAVGLKKIGMKTNNLITQANEEIRRLRRIRSLQNLDDDRSNTLSTPPHSAAAPESRVRENEDVDATSSHTPFDIIQTDLISPGASQISSHRGDLIREYVDNQYNNAVINNDSPTPVTSSVNFNSLLEAPQIEVHRRTLSFLNTRIDSQSAIASDLRNQIRSLQENNESLLSRIQMLEERNTILGFIFDFFPDIRSILRFGSLFVTTVGGVVVLYRIRPRNPSQGHLDADSSDNDNMDARESSSTDQVIRIPSRPRFHDIWIIFKMWLNSL